MDNFNGHWILDSFCNRLFLSLFYAVDAPNSVWTETNMCSSVSVSVLPARFGILLVGTIVFYLKLSTLFNNSVPHYNVFHRIIQNISYSKYLYFTQRSESRTSENTINLLFLLTDLFEVRSLIYVSLLLLVLLHV